MATDIKISELNQITVNSDLNQLIINDRENAGDTGISKKIQISNLLTPNIVKTDNITDCAVITSKINDKAVTAGKIADNTITSSQITCCGITNSSLATNSVDNRTVNNSDNFTFNCVTAATNVTTPLATVTSKLTVGAIGGGKTVSLNGINYDFPPTEVPNYFLQTDGSGNLTWEEAVPGDGTALVFSEISPVGTIISWAGAALPSDGKWLECNGTTFDGTDFPELSSVLGDTWGTHSGVNYYLPDLKGRAAVGAGTGNDGTDSCAFTLGDEGGKYRHTLIYSQMPAHRHVGAFGENNTIFSGRWGNIATSPGQGSSGGIDSDNDRYGFTTYAGGQSTENGQTVSPTATTPHNNIQPYAVTRYIIKALPDDIQQFSMDVGPGLSALNASGGQTASIDLSSSEIGLKVTDDFQFDGSGRLEINTAWVNENLDQGKPIQYVNNHINTTHRYTKTADVDLHITQLDTAATLKNTSSKVYITAMITAESYTHNGVWKLFRKVGAVETEIGSNITSGVNNRKGIATGMYDGNDEATPNNVYIQFMDSPGAVNVTYLFKWNSDGTGANYFALNGARKTNNGEDYEMASSNVNLVEIGG